MNKLKGIVSSDVDNEVIVDEELSDLDSEF